MYLLGLFLISTGMVGYYFQTHTIVTNVVVNKYRRFQKLKQLVSTKYQTKCMILWICFCMIVKMFWLQFLHWINSSIEYIDRRTVVISYVLNGKLYKMAVTSRKGPVDILLVIDDKDEEITDLVLPFLGPAGDWHGKAYTPDFWKRKSITFHMSSGETKTFLTDQSIVI